ncbi:hypothetical protein BHU72_05550 [Desulfuribacillus stibiiarsenatis]|uniref:HAMP domain-containing protein n=1 Tax=Desulfuribacillus stibiiarsenatis TaxID=1390249 RepID=A0A1E5L4P3_9FIRM|nr:HAMP domain-containing protein [Desulfuribacillus stibiiarsenatis]OEH85076.1 hypothetical protein BHU72_05550 [Desulfuribacillus stibiiarsenatis]
MGVGLSGKTLFDEWYHDGIEVISPITLNGTTDTILIIGLSMERVYQAVQNNVLIVAILGLGVFLVVGTVLYQISKETVKIIRRLNAQIGQIASGDFSKDMPMDLLNRKNEFGEIAKIISIHAGIHS